MSIRHLLVAMTAAALASSSSLGDDATSAFPGISGKWIATKLVINGTEIAPEALAAEPFFWEFHGDAWRYAFVVDGKRVVIRFKVALTPSDAGCLVDAKLWSGESRGKVVKGICSVAGDTMRLCIADDPSMDRPDRFACDKDSGLHLFELRRDAESSSPTVRGIP